MPNTTASNFRPPCATPLSRDELVQAEGMRPGDDLFGMALSGGGIRSATFSLGLLQGLQKTGLLKALDYVSTVSGGGYTGAFWTAWRHKTQAPALFPERPDQGVEHPSIRHLRRFSNYLSPRLGLLSNDTGRLAVAGLTALIPTLLATLALLVLAVLAWVGAAATLFSGGPWAYRTFFGVTLVTLVLFEAAWIDREGRPMDGVYAWAAAGALLLLALGLGSVTAGASLAAEGGAALVLPTLTATADVGRLRHFLPVLLWGSAFLLLTLVRAAGSRFADTFRGLVARAALDRVLSRLLFLAAAWMVITALWLLASALYSRIATSGLNAAMYSAATAALAAAFAWSRKIGTAEPNKPFGSELAARLRPRLPQLAAYAVVVLVVVAVMMGVIAAEAAAVLGWTAGVAGAITVATLLFFHPNRIGLHAFYRGRLSRAYLGASTPDNVGRKVFTEESEGDDVPLHTLAGGAGARPVHLVCCAVNDLLPPEPLTNMQRGATSAVLSPFGLAVADTEASGEQPAGVYWSAWQGASPTLGAAITASGAAFNSMMGSFSKRLGPAATFVLAMLNLRLGMWQQHPRYYGRHSGQRSVHGWLARLAVRIAGERSAREWWLPGLRFYRELFGMSSAQGRDVHLSDGGHFENTGVYELIRRECRYIIAADCGADPDRAFDDVANLVRRVRQDFGADIRIDLSPLHLDDAHRATQPMVAGDIHYASGDTGVLLLFKPTLVGSEPPDVTQYRTRNAAFPNESTGDQFYDEAQWEAYRQLGEHAATMAFGFLQKSRTRLTAGEGRDFVARAFALARFEWLPRPALFEERLARFNERAADLEVELTRGLTMAVTDTGADRPATAATASPASPGAIIVELKPSLLPEGLALQQSLDTVRRTILFMEETYYTWDLEAMHGKPLSLGVMNCIGTWTRAPLLRMWWPLLKPLHSPPFTRFLENHFGLAGIQLAALGGGTDDGLTESNEPDTHGLAGYCWQLAGAPDRSPGDPRYVPAHIGLELHLSYEGAPVAAIQAATVRAFRARQERVLYWHADDFFVPPGLWGSGIGEHFLNRLRGLQRADGADQWVAVSRPVPGDVAGARSLADRRRMYKAAGFADAVTGPAGLDGGNRVAWLVRRASG
jgi:hypothetical protein